MKSTRLYFILILAFGISSCASKRSTVLQSPTNKKDVHRSIENTRTSSGTSSSGLNYISQYKDIAIAEMNQYGIPASIKLAQALLESGSGNSYLAREANNHFGIKCGGVWSGKSVTRPDDKVDDCFRVYDNPEQSFRDHSQFLLRKRYEKLFLLDKNDYRGWARGLKDAGYATNPRYPDLLIDLIERYQLYKYDRAEASYVAKEQREEKVEEIIQEKAVQEPQVQTEQIKNAVAMIIHEVKASETLFSISTKYRISVEQLKQLNGLSSDNLSIGQLLVISK
ncbi:glucosaminidase domain-containing protein [Sphingobacterium sp. LRF_L2]|uniref:glucosaminidase domain-containing protein n=1 Tax=Sphingobacterium sp. LRF_L2 TaxID=3369421 RepID=UPI003F5E9DEA